MKIISETSDAFARERRDAQKAALKLLSVGDRATILDLVDRFTVTSIGEIGRLEVLAAIGNLANRLEGEHGTS
jgi:hypothetical protein